VRKYDLWDQIPFGTKIDLAGGIANYVSQIQSLRLHSIGSLYFPSVKQHVHGKIARFTAPGDHFESTSAEESNYQDYVIGHTVSPWFFRDMRARLLFPRGLSHPLTK